jgi:acyl carrier protein
VKKSEIFEGIQHVFKEFLGIVDITPEIDIIEDLQLDSVNLLTLIVELENYFHVSFEEGEEENIRTINELILLIEQSIKEKNR